MQHPKAEISVYTGDGEPVHLSGIPYCFNPGERSLHMGADNTGAVVTRAGWLGLHLDPFKGWQSAHTISITGESGRDSDLVYEVKRNFNSPVQDGDWLWFPAMPNGVAPYVD